MKTGGGGLASGLLNGQHVVPQLAQFLHYWEREVLVRVEAGHTLRFLIFANLLLDFVPVRADVSPGIGQILGTQRRVGSEQFRLARAQSPGLLQDPDRDAGPHDTRIPTTAVRDALDPWAGITTG